MTHFTEVSPEELGILEDANLGVINTTHISIQMAYRIYQLQGKGWLAGLELTLEGAEILESLDEFRASLKIKRIKDKFK